MFINIANNIVAECLPSGNNQIQWQNGDLHINTNQIVSINHFCNCNLSDVTKNFDWTVLIYESIELKEVFEVCLSDKRVFFLYFWASPNTGKYSNPSSENEFLSIFKS